MEVGMSSDIIKISDDLWLEINPSELKYSGLFDLCASEGEKVPIDVAEIPALIDALNKLVEVTHE
jgi:hypothetical protein